MSKRRRPPIRSRIYIDLDDRQLCALKIRDAVQDEQEDAAPIEHEQAAHVAEADVKQANRPVAPPPKPYDKRH